jgi:hypothetical protein
MGSCAPFDADMAASPSARRFDADHVAGVRSPLRTVLAFDEARRNLAWLHQNYGSVQRRAAGRYVVVWRQRLMAHHRTLAGARQRAAAKACPLDEALIQYIPAKGEVRMFCLRG